MVDKKTQAYYKDIFLENLDDISSGEKQEKAWVQGDYNGFNTFIEIFEGFISPCESVKAWTILSAEQRQNLEKLYDLLIKYDDTKRVGKQIVTKSDKEICQDPAWEEIRKFGRRLYKELKEVSFLQC